MSFSKLIRRSALAPSGRSRRALARRAAGDGRDGLATGHALYRRGLSIFVWLLLVIMGLQVASPAPQIMATWLLTGPVEASSAASPEEEGDEEQRQDETIEAVWSRPQRVQVSRSTATATLRWRARAAAHTVAARVPTGLAASGPHGLCAPLRC